MYVRLYVGAESGCYFSPMAIISQIVMSMYYSDLLLCTVLVILNDCYHAGMFLLLLGFTVNSYRIKHQMF